MDETECLNMLTKIFCEKSKITLVALLLALYYNDDMKNNTLRDIQYT